MKQKSVIFLIILIIFSNCKKEELVKKYVIDSTYYDNTKTKIFESDSIIELKESDASFDTLIIDSVYTITKNMVFNIDNDLHNCISSIKFYMEGTWTKRSNGTKVFTNKTYVAPQTCNNNVIGGLNTTEVFPWALQQGDGITGSIDWKNEKLLLSSFTKYYVPQFNDSIVLDSISNYKENNYVAFRLQKQANEYNYGWVAAQVINYRKLVVNNLTYIN